MMNGMKFPPFHAEVNGGHFVRVKMFSASIARIVVSRSIEFKLFKAWS